MTLRAVCSGGGGGGGWAVENYHATLFGYFSLKKCLMYMTYRCKHTESLYKLMATEQKYCFYHFFFEKRLEVKLFKYLLCI